LSGRGLYDELITRPEESYRLCCVVVCDLETSRMGAPYIYDISRLRVNGSEEYQAEGVTTWNHRFSFMYSFCECEVSVMVRFFLSPLGDWCPMFRDIRYIQHLKIRQQICLAPAVTSHSKDATQILRRIKTSSASLRKPKISFLEGYNL